MRNQTLRNIACLGASVGDGAKEPMQIRRCKAHPNHALQELMQITRCKGSYG